MDDMPKAVLLFIVNSEFAKTANLAFPLYKEFFKENPTIKFEDFNLQLNNLVKDDILKKNAGPKGETYKLTWKAEQSNFLELYLSDNTVVPYFPKSRNERINPTTQKINRYAKHKKIIKSWLETISWIAGIVAAIIGFYQLIK